MKLIEQVILLPFRPGYIIISKLKQDIREGNMNPGIYVAKGQTKQLINCLDELKQRLNEQLN